MSSSPLREETNLISFTILSRGKEIPDIYEIESIRVERHVNRIAEAEIIILDGNAAKQTFEVTDSDTFKPGSEVEIKMGYHGKDDTVFKGVVIKQLIKVVSDSERGSHLQVVCKDKALKMAINRKNAIYTKEKDSSIISKVIEKNGLEKDVSSTTVEHKEVVQYYATDWDFIITRAEVNGMVVTTDDGKLTIAKPKVSASPELQVQFGVDLIEFDGEIDATYQFQEASANSWDMSTQSVVNAKSSEPSVNKQGDITGKSLSGVLSSGPSLLNSSSDISQETIQNWANAALLKSRLSRFKGSVTFQGSAKAKVNSTIKLMGLSDRFDGNAFIAGVTHTIEDGDWLTEVQIGLSADWFSETRSVSASAASGLLPAVTGLQTGIVKKVYEDPDNQFRVQVELPLLKAEGEAIWARLSTFYASNGFGAYFMPEIGDEVILGFMNDDPRFPVILGSVYSSARPAAETPDEQNTFKSLVTRSKMQFKFDDEKKIITLLTPGGNTMVYSDEDQSIIITDQNSNKVIMNSDGITLQSPASINIKATADVNIQGANVNIKAEQSINDSAAQISISGEMSTSISGGAECSISSDGNLTAKGLMVMIN